MSGSSPDGKQFFKEWYHCFLSTVVPDVFHPKRVLDVGPGSGAYGVAIREIDYLHLQDKKKECQKYKNSLSEIEAIEIFAPYVERYALNSIYDKVYVQDIRDFSKRNEKTYDLIIFGDVLEHLSKPDALDVWKRMRLFARFLMISLPIIVPGRSWSIDYNQGPHEYTENPNEKHLHTWKYDELISEMGPFLWRNVYQFVGIFIAEGEI